MTLFIPDKSQYLMNWLEIERAVNNNLALFLPDKNNQYGSNWRAIELAINSGTSSASSPGFIGATTAATQNSGGLGATAINVPSNVTVGSILVVLASASGVLGMSGTWATTITGSGMVAWRTATSSEPASYNILNTAFLQATGAMLAYTPGAVTGITILQGLGPIAVFSPRAPSTILEAPIAWTGNCTTPYTVSTNNHNPITRV